MRYSIRVVCFFSIYLFFCTKTVQSQINDLAYNYNNYPTELSQLLSLPEINEIYLYSCNKFLKIGDSLYNMDRKQEAGILYRKIIPYILLYRPEFASEIYLRIGNACPDKSKATEYYRTALTYIIHTKQGMLTKAKLLTNIARILMINGQYNKAINYLDSSISIFLVQRDSLNGAIALMQKANTYNLTNEKEKAIVNYTHAIQLLSNNNNEKFIQLQSRVIYNLAGLYIEENKEDSALLYLSRIVPVFERLSDEEQLIHHYFTGYIYLLKKKYSKAEYYIQYSLRLAEVKNYSNIVLYSHNALANLYKKTGDIPKAWHYSQKYFDMQKEIFEQTKADINKINQLESNYTLAQKNKDLTEKQLLIIRQEKNLAQKNLWLVATISGASMVILLAFGIVRSYRRKQRFLQKEQEIVTLKALIEGEEKERQRLSRELHDGIGGMLAAVKFKVGHIRKSTKEPDISEQLEDVMEMLQDTSSEVRTTAHNLLPDMLNLYPLKVAILAYIGKMNSLQSIQVELDAPDTLSTLSKTVELILFRMIQELVHNAMRHAAASYVSIQLLEHENELILLVEDDGKGFDPQKKTGYGLENLKYRVHGLQGAIEIDSAPGKGTAIRITFNLQQLKEITI